MAVRCRHRKDGAFLPGEVRVHRYGSSSGTWASSMGPELGPFCLGESGIPGSVTPLLQNLPWLPTLSDQALPTWCLLTTTFSKAQSQVLLSHSLPQTSTAPRGQFQNPELLVACPAHVLEALQTCLLCTHPRFTGSISLCDTSPSRSPCSGRRVHSVSQ